MRVHPVLFLLVLMAMPLPGHGQDFGKSLKRTAERAVQGEVERAVDREVRRAPRCALGDERCATDARRRGEEVEYVDERGRVAAAPATTSGAAGQQAPAGSFRVVPYAGSGLRDSEVQAFDEYNFVVGRQDNGDLRSRRLEGRVSKEVYDNPGGRSTLEIARNYEQALTGQGLRIVQRCAGRTECGGTGTREANWTRVADMNIGVGGDFRYLAAEGQVGGRAIAVAVMVNKQRHWVYVRPESSEALAQVAELMRTDASLVLEIVGHTDDVGDAGANQRLSEERALAVRSALVIEHRVPDRRLRSRGAGESEPVAPNSSEAGRALNRRVELVKP